MTLNEQIYVASLAKAIQDAKITGNLDITIPYLFNQFSKWELWTRYKPEYTATNIYFKDQVSKLRYKYPKKICKYSVTLPTGSYDTTGTVVAPTTTSPTLTSFSVDSFNAQIYPTSSTIYKAYRLSKTDLLANYSDTEDDDFFQVKINRTDLDLGSIKIVTGTGSTDYMIFEEDPSYITILASDLSNVYFFTDDLTQASNDLSIQVIDKDIDGNLWVSNSATITMNKTVGGNAPATIGDAAIKTANQVTTTLTLAMFTTGLTPPYNDPESDLIDAIRIDEISTANVGEFQYNSVAITEGQIITREDLDAGLFTHVGASSADIETDSFNFSARDEGSGVWVQ